MTLLAQALERAVERDDRPLASEHTLRRVVVAAVESIRALRLLEIEREADVPSSAPHRGCALVLVDDVPLEGGEEESTKPPSPRIGSPEALPFQ